MKFSLTLRAQIGTFLEGHTLTIESRDGGFDLFDEEIGGPSAIRLDANYNEIENENDPPAFKTLESVFEAIRFHDANDPENDLNLGPNDDSKYDPICYTLDLN